MPPVWVYLVNPAARAAIAACLMNSGVSKSGSPATKLNTSTPLATSALTFAAWASVCDGLIGWSRRAKFMLNGYQPCLTRFKSRRPRKRGCLSPTRGLAELALQFAKHVRRHQTLDAPAERSDLPHQLGRNVEVILAGHHEYRLDFRRELPVHVRHLKLVFEIGDRPKPTQDHAHALPPGVVDQESLEPVHLHPRIGTGFSNELLALFNREQRRLGLILGDRHHQPVEHLKASLDQAQVPIGQRIERSRIDGSWHRRGVSSGIGPKVKKRDR